MFSLQSKPCLTMTHSHYKVRDNKYLSIVRGEPCLICGKEGEAHHIMYAEPRGVALKVGDNWVVPMCHEHHMDIHHYGNEKKWWTIQGVDPIEWAKKNWSKYNETRSKKSKLP